jgi:predicted phage-related endonuclease
MADWGSDGSDVVPKQYVVQCQHNMFVLRARGFQVSEALVPVLVDLSEFRIYRVPYAHDVASALAKQACLWWEKHVVGKRPPPPDGTPSYQDYLDTAYPKPQRGAEIVAPSEMTRWAANYQEAHAAKKQAERQLREAEQQLCIALGEAESIVGDGWRASWRPNKNGDRRFRFQGATDEG